MPPSSFAPTLPSHDAVCDHMIASLSSLLAAEAEEWQKLRDKQLVRRVGSARAPAKSRSISVDAVTACGAPRRRSRSRPPWLVSRLLRRRQRTRQSFLFRFR